MIGLIDSDLLDNGTRHPNLALMKISSYHKSRGDKVSLVLDYSDIERYDKIYLSKVFKFTRIPVDVLNKKNLVYGGTGFEDLDLLLDDEIEHMKPDYDLYLPFVESEVNRGVKRSKYNDYLNYSIGFTTRGCFRKCDFCVNKKYSKVFSHSPINEFLDETKPYIYLWDDNFLGYKDWEIVLDELIDTNKPFQFRQGLDIRLMTEKKARKLSSVKYHGDFIFAFDHIDERKVIEEKLKIWMRYARKTTKLYVLCAYDSQGIDDIENTFERIKILLKHKALPYIMRYEEYVNSPHKGLYIQLARWCNQPNIIKKMSFRDFAKANQKMHKNKKTKCSTMKVFEYYEANYPKLASKYFDIRFNWGDNDE